MTVAFSIMARRWGWPVVVVLLVMQVTTAFGGVGLIDAGIDDPPEPAIPPKLFARIDPQQKPQASFRQEWTVTIEQAAIQQPAEAIELNLPDHETVLVSRLHWEARAGFIPSADGYNGQIPDPDAEPSVFSWRWYGKSDRGYTIALTLSQGQLAGRIWAPANVHYTLEPGRDATTLGLIRRDFWGLHPPEPDDPRADEATTLEPAASASINGISLGGAWDLTCSGPLPTAFSPIDVLVMYTPNMIDGTSPTGYASLAAFTAAVQTSIDNANQALRNVGIYSYAYSLRGIEPADAQGYSDLTITKALGVFSGIQNAEPLADPWCTYPGNAYVAGRRTAMWADVMALARASNDNLCGVSKGQRHVEIRDCPRDPGPGYSPFAYLVFNPKCDADKLNLAHELGHILGMEHDPKNASNLQPPNKPSCPWSFGHRRGDISGASRFRFHTVMAYPTDAGTIGLAGPPQCLNAADCPLIDAYSDPTREWDGFDDGINLPPYGLRPLGSLAGAWPIGDITTLTWRDSNATQTLPRLAPIVAAFQARPDRIFANGFER